MFSIRIREPRSVGGRVWNLAQDLLAIALAAPVVLKLVGVIGWSWWWVLSPLWIGGIQLAPAACGLLTLLAWGAVDDWATFRRSGS